MNEAHSTFPVADRDSLMEVLMNKQPIPQYIPPSASAYQNKLSNAHTYQEQVSVITEWAMKSGLCNNINEKLYDKLLDIKRGITL